MEFSTANLKKPSNKKFALISNSLLYTLPLYSGAFLFLSEHIEGHFPIWGNFIVTMLVITIKGISKFTSQEDVPVETVTE